MIRLENLTKLYGSFVAVDDISLHVPRGVLYGCLGPNGAGKTTTLRIDRKSTRLNSSHDQNSYAVFCLKKKKKVIVGFQDQDVNTLHPGSKLSVSGGQVCGVEDADQLARNDKPHGLDRVVFFF